MGLYVIDHPNDILSEANQIRILLLFVPKKIKIMSVNKRRLIKVIAYSVLVIVLVATGVGYYLFNLPKRDVQSSNTDYNLSASDLVKEYIANSREANKKYLKGDGDSKILSVTGKVYSISLDLNNQKVVLLKDSSEKAGVSCTFIEATNGHTVNLRTGENIEIKGVIRSGAGYDKDLDLYEDVIMEKCDIINH